MSKTKNRSEINTDILVVGGGLNGLPLAIALASAGLEVVVLEREDPKTITSEIFDGRVSAIAHASRNLLRTIGVWEHVQQTQPMLDIRITDGPSKQFLHYDHRQLGDEPFGHMVENRHLRLAILKRAAELEALNLLAPATYRTVTRDQDGVQAELEDGRVVKARLIVAADGRLSPLRKLAGIGTVGWRYDQAGIVCTVAHELPHKGVAQERFLNPGPFAILPMTGNRSSLVWTEQTDTAAKIMSLEDTEFEAAMSRRFGTYLGDIEVVGPRWSYPLALHQADDYIAERMVLIGDAAHGMHPIAGQGLNLGLRDVAALAEIITDAARLGLDPGTGNNLEKYQQWRRFDSVALLAITDGLNRLFTTDVGPVRLARDTGLSLVNNLPRVKGFFMEHARGTVGKLPRLLEGKPL